MLYDFHTYDLKPRTVAELEERVAEVLPMRLEISPLGGFWHTEAGPLNQIIHIWPYERHGTPHGVAGANAFPECLGIAG